jgi:2,5-furandicarboxylate decarboxylase 1
MFQDLRSFLSHLQQSGELAHVGEKISPRFEIPAVIKYAAVHKRQALLFERVKGYDVPVVGNLLGTHRRVAMAMGVAERELAETVQARLQRPTKPQILAAAPVQEVGLDRGIDILKTMPVLTHYEKDVGPYFTSAVTVAKSPQNGARSMGIHRIQVRNGDSVSIFLSSGSLCQFLSEAEGMGKPLEIAIFVGADPLTFLSGALPAHPVMDKFEIAGGLVGRPIEMVKCLSVDLEVPAHAEFVLEGEIIPNRREKDGPFGESTGIYHTALSPVAKIKTITHRRQPIYHALMPFAEERIILELLGLLYMERAPEMIQAKLLGVQSMKMRGAIGEIAVVQVSKKDDGDGPKVIDFLLAANPILKLVIVVDEDVDVDNDEEVDWALSTRVRPDKDVVIKSNLPAIDIDPCSYEGKASKMGIDATKPLVEVDRFEKTDVPVSVKQKVARLVSKIGL